MHFQVKSYLKCFEIYCYRDTQIYNKLEKHMSRPCPSAICEPARLPNHFYVQEAEIDSDNSCVYMNKETMKAMKAQNGDYVFMRNPKTRNDTLGVICEGDADYHTVRINHIFRKNLSIEVGELVHLELYHNIAEHSRVVVKTISGWAPLATPEDHERIFLIEYFQNNYRPICRDDFFEIKTPLGTMQFVISHTEPCIYGLVTSQTLLAIDRSIANS